MENGSLKREGEKKNLWQSFLSEVSSRSGPPDSFLILLGNRESGKRDIIQNINSRILKKRPTAKSILNYQKSGSNYSLLDYFFLDAKDPTEMDADDIFSKLHVWYIDSPEEVELLKTIMKPEFLPQTMFVVVLDYQHPWRFLEDMKNWLEVVHQVVQTFFPKLPLAQQDDLREELLNYIRLYEDPVVDQKTGLLITSNRKFKRAKVQAQEEEEAEEEEEKEAPPQIPLREGVLTANLGVPITIVCNKSENFKSTGGIAEMLNKHFEIIQYHLRQKCLTCKYQGQDLGLDGAALINISTQQMINVDLLYEYIMHRLYDLEFKNPHQTFEPEKFFIPAGWDSLTLIQELEGKKREEPFEELLKNPGEELKVADQEEVQLQFESSWNLEEFMKESVKDPKSKLHPKRESMFGEKGQAKSFFQNMMAQKK